MSIIVTYSSVLVGVHPGVNFINMFTRSFYARRSQKCKKLLDLSVFFALLGSARVKDARKMLVKLTSGVDTNGSPAAANKQNSK